MVLHNRNNKILTCNLHFLAYILIEHNRMVSKLMSSKTQQLNNLISLINITKKVHPKLFPNHFHY